MLVWFCNLRHELLPDSFRGAVQLPGRMQFGYVSLFAAAMPVAAAIACVYTAVEMRSDLVKLVHVCRRPAADRRLSIGAWRVVMQVQAWLAILTNCVVFAFSSDQVIEYFPSLFKTLRLPSGGVDKVLPRNLPYDL